MSIPLIDIQAQYKNLKSEIDERIHQVLDHGQFIMGPEVLELEEQLAEYVGATDCITVSSGTEALLISLMALDIGVGDEVITSPFSFVATAEVIALRGATPVFVDIEPHTCNLDPKKLEAAVNSKTKAIIPVSMYGQTCDMDAINAVALRHHLPVIEDAAQSFGATYKGRKSCGLSAIGCTSFFPSKPLGCYGDGGAIFTSDQALAKRMREIRVHGQERRYYSTQIGVGGRMDTLQCAVVLAKLKAFDWEVDRRVDIGQTYLELLEPIGHVETLQVADNNKSVWAQFTIKSENRDQLSAHLKSRGIPTAVHYPLSLHRQPAYADICRCATPMDVVDQAAKTVISLPMHAFLDIDTQRSVVAAIKDFEDA